MALVPNKKKEKNVNTKWKTKNKLYEKKIKLC